MKSVAVIQTAFLGDLLLTVPLLKYISKIWPGAEITLVARKGFGPTFQELGLVDRVIEVDKSGKRWRRKTIKDLPEVDLLLVPHQSVSSLIWSLKSRSTHKIGYSGPLRRMVFHRTVERQMELPEALRLLLLLGPFSEDLQKKLEDYRVQNRDVGALRVVPEWASMRLAQPTLESLKMGGEKLITKLGVGEKLAVIAPGSVWPTKRWSVEGFVDLAKNLKAKGFEVLLTGSSSEKDICQAVASESGALDLSGGLSILETLSLMSQSQVIVSNDSGAMHMASLVDTPCVSIFGPTVLSFGYQPWQDHARVVEIKGLKCRPCSSHGTEKCPLVHHKCMKLIKSDDVLSEVLKLIPH